MLAELGYYDLHVIGVEKRRADTLKRGRRPRRPPRGAPGERGPARSATASRRSRASAPWTVGRGRPGWPIGDADAVSVGDFHLKHLVAWALAGEPRGTDDRMLELLEPFAGHRGRVCLLIESSRHQRPDATAPASASSRSLAGGAEPLTPSGRRRSG